MSTPEGAWGSINSIPQHDLNWAPPTRTPSPDLDRDAFLQLLIVQLQHQDPLNPMDDRDFIAQMAQFSALEQMIQLNQTFERSQAYSMIGQVIEFSFPHPITGEWIDDYGMVTAVTRQGNNVFMTVNDMDVPFEAIREVRSNFFSDIVMNEIFQQVMGQRAQDLVGRYIQAIVSAGEGNPPVFVEGRVDSVRFATNGQAILSVGTREIFFPQDVASVADGRRLLGAEHSNRFIYNNQAATVVNVEFTHAFEAGEQVTRAYLVLAMQDGTQGRARINNINLATDAMGFMDRPMNHGGVSGVARSVTVRGGIPFLNIYNASNERVGQIDFADYLAVRAGVTGEGENA